MFLLVELGIFSQESGVNNVLLLNLLSVDSELEAREMKIFDTTVLFHTKEVRQRVPQELSKLLVLDHENLLKLLNGNITFEQLETMQLVERNNLHVLRPNILGQVLHSQDDEERKSDIDSVQGIILSQLHCKLQTRTSRNYLNTQAMNLISVMTLTER